MFAIDAKTKDILKSLNSSYRVFNEGATIWAEIIDLTTKKVYHKDSGGTELEAVQKAARGLTAIDKPQSPAEMASSIKERDAEIEALKATLDAVGKDGGESKSKSKTTFIQDQVSKLKSGAVSK